MACTTASKSVMLDLAVLVAFRRTSSASAVRKSKAFCVDSPDFLVNSSVAAFLTARTISAKRSATSLSACLVRKILHGRYTVQVATRRLQVFLEGKEKIAWSLFQSVNRFVRGSFLVEDTSALSSATSMSVCVARSWSTKAASATKPKSRCLA